MGDFELLAPAIYVVGGSDDFHRLPARLARRGRQLSAQRSAGVREDAGVEPRHV